MVACPYCRQPAMTRWEKLKTRPRQSLSCRSCGRKIAISRAWLLAILLPATIGAFIADASRSLTLGAIAIAGGSVVAVCMYLYAVPIVGRDD